MLSACALRPVNVPGEAVEPARMMDVPAVGVASAQTAPDVSPSPSEARPLDEKSGADRAAIASPAPLPLAPRADLPAAYFPDLHRSLQAELASGEAARIASARRAIEADPAVYPPYLLASLSDALVDAGERERAAFWFYASHLRARYDANRCNLSPVSERQVRLLAETYGRGVAGDALENPRGTAATLDAVMDFDAATPNTYDPRWVYYLPATVAPVPRGAGMAPPPEALCQPEDRWPLIKDATRIAFARDMAAMIPAFVPSRTAARQP